VVSRTGDVGTTISYAEASNSFANAPSVKALVHEDSRTVAMEVVIVCGLCNNSLAEWTSPENGLR